MIGQYTQKNGAWQPTETCHINEKRVTLCIDYQNYSSNKELIVKNLKKVSTQSRKNLDLNMTVKISYAYVNTRAVD